MHADRRELVLAGDHEGLGAVGHQRQNLAGRGVDGVNHRAAAALGLDRLRQVGGPHRADVDDLLPAGGLVVLGTPTSPTGELLDDDEISCVLTTAQERESTVVLDEAFSSLDASLRADLRAAAEALGKLASAAPADQQAWTRYAETLVANREFETAASALRRAIELDPSAGLYWNSLAYAYAYMGRFDEALKAVARYAQLDSSPNPADSRGEILMMAGRFQEAAQAFEESYGKDRNFNGGAAIEKAALCRLLQGDGDGAGKSVARLLEDRAELGDRTVDLRRARWKNSR